MRKYAIALPVYFLCSLMAFAQTAASDDAFRRFDAAISVRSVSGAAAVLSSSAENDWYPKLETYVMKRIRQLVIQNDLEFARDVTLSVIDSDLDNVEAVDMYQSIKKAIAAREEETRKTAEKKEVEAYRQKAAEEKIRQDLSKDYKMVTNASSGKKVYLEQDFNTHYRTMNWDIMLGLATVGSVFVPSLSPDLKYGLAFGAAFYYRGDSLVVGADIDGNAMLLTFMGEQATTWSSSITAALGSPSFSKYLVGRAGFAVNGYNYGISYSGTEIFATPSAGIGVHDVRIGTRAWLATSADWYPAHLWNRDMLFAGGVKADLTFTLADMQDFDIMLRIGVKDAFFLYSGDTRNDMKATLSIGVGDYE